MRLQYPKLRPGSLIRRYKRFLADVLLEEDASASTAIPTTVHCPNTGPMTGLLDRENAPVYVSTHESAKRKYAHTLEMIQPEQEGAWVGVHSALANKVVAQLLERRLIPALGLFESCQAEVSLTPDMFESAAASSTAGKAAATEAANVSSAQPARRAKRGRDACPVPSSASDPVVSTARAKKAARTVKGATHSRIDFVLAHADGSRTFVEVKSVTLAEAYAPGGPGAKIALFPDTVSERAQRHVRDLVALKAAGHKAACVYVVQRGDCCAFAPCYAKDPAYAALVARAKESGVIMIPLSCSLDPVAGELCLRGTLDCVLTYNS